MLQYTNGGCHAITGASLAQRRRRMRRAERAILAADIIDERVVLQGLTVKTIAGLVGTSVDYVYRALRLTPQQREAVRRGDRSLILPRKRGPDPFDWNAIDDDVLIEAIRRVAHRSSAERCDRGRGFGFRLGASVPVQAGTDPSITNMSAPPATKDRPIYVLELRPEPGVDPIRALRALLKHSLRRYGLRCIAAHESEDKRSCDENCRSR